MDCQTEIAALQAIYPELELTGSRSGTIEISVAPVRPVQVTFTQDSQMETIKDGHSSDLTARLEHLPPLCLSFQLPELYPEEEPPVIDLDCLWLDHARKQRLLERLSHVWADLDHDNCLYSIIDIATEFVTDEVDFVVSLPREFKDKILTYDARAIVSEFSKQSFKCEICQYMKRGALCTKLNQCGHVYCTDCLKEYFTACIEQGYVNQVICPFMTCRKPILDEELLALVGNKLVTRFTELKSKLKVESQPGKFLFCPRDLCQGLIERSPDDLLTVCPSCKYAFCYVCKRSWHGYYQYCRVQEPSIQIVRNYIDGDDETRLKLEREWGKKNMELYVRNFEAEESFQRYMEENHNMPCPKCSAPIERSMGCNKMTCSICNTFFCFLCGDILMQHDPYKHYASSSSCCFQKLFEGTIQEPEEEMLLRFLQ